MFVPVLTCSNEKCPVIRCVAESERDRVIARVASKVRMVFSFNVLLQIYGSAVLTVLKMSHRDNSLNFSR